jgi:hypothetical protein
MIPILRKKSESKGVRNDDHDPNWLATLPRQVGAEAVAKRIRDLVLENERLREEIRAMQGEK